MKLSSVASWAALSLLVTACGGGGGGDAGTTAPPSAPAPTPTPTPATGTLNAQEQLAYASWMFRKFTTDWVEDRDEALFFNPSVRTEGKAFFAGLYPQGTGTGAGSTGNTPQINTSAMAFQCANGGTKSETGTLAGPGSVLTVVYQACKDSTLVVDGSRSISKLATALYYTGANSNAIKSDKLNVAQDYSFKETQAAGTYTATRKGVLEVDITETQRVYKLTNMVMNYGQSNNVGNTTITLQRTLNFGTDQPFTVTSLTGTVSVEGTVYTLSSSNIPWRTVVNYFPQSGSLTATGPAGEKIVTTFGPTGASCSLTLAGAVAPSVVTIFSPAGPVAVRLPDWGK